MRILFTGSSFELIAATSNAPHSGKLVVSIPTIPSSSENSSFHRPNWVKEPPIYLRDIVIQLLVLFMNLTIFVRLVLILFSSKLRQKVYRHWRKLELETWLISLLASQ